MTPPITLQLLGAPRLRSGDDIAQPLAPKDALLLALLALDGTQPRDQLAALLWPSNTAATARANLRQRVRRLQSLGALLDVQGQTLALQPAVHTDLQQLPTLLLADAGAARGALLGQLRFDDEDAASQWLGSARSRVHEARNQALQAHADALAASDHWGQALPWLQRLVADNPADEARTRQLMQWHHRAADRGAAAAVYATLRDALLQDHGASPDPQTRALAAWIALPDPGAAEAAAAPAIARAALQRPPQRIALDAEWAQLERVWVDGGTAVVLGDAGSGKTRLLGDFADHVALPLRLRAHEGDRHVPHALLARWVAAREDAARLLPAWAQRELATLHPALGPLPAPPTTALRLGQALGLLAQADSALWIDDLHFADSASLALLPMVLAGGLRCCLLALRGPVLPAPLQQWLDQSPQRVCLLPLRPWPVDGVRSLLTRTALPLADADAWAAQLWRHTGGQPLLVLEILRALLQERPADTADTTPWPLPPTLPIPRAVAHFVTTRLAALSPLAREITQVAALAGEAFAADLAAQVMDRPLPALGPPWAELQTAGLMHEDGLLHGQLHGVVLAAVRQALPAPVRMALHAAIARQLAVRGAAPAQLAHHWQEAGASAEAAACHETAAQAAVQQSRRDAQRHHWGQAALLWAQAGRADAAFAAAAAEAEAALMAGHPGDCLALADALQPRASNPKQWAQVLRLRAWALSYRREWAAALEVTEKAQAPMQTIGDMVWLSEMVGLQAILAALLGRTELAEQSLQRARDLQLDPADWELRLNHLSRISDALGYLQRVPEALATLEACLPLSERPEARTQRIGLLGNTTMLLYRLGRRDAALARSREGVALADSAGQLQGQPGAQALMQTAMLAAASGQFGQALELADRAMPMLAALQLPHVLAVAQNHLAWIWCCLGQPARSLQLLRSDEADVDLPTRLRRWTLRDELQRLCGSAAAGPPPADWADCLDPSVRALAEVAMDRRLEPALAEPRLLALATRLHDRDGLPGHALHARVWRLPALRMRDPAAAAREALALRAAMRHAQPLAAYWPEVLCLLHDTLQGNDDTDAVQAAAACRAEAQAWVQQAAQPPLPPALREGFLQRNRVNLRLGAGDGPECR